MVYLDVLPSLGKHADEIEEKIPDIYYSGDSPC